jgi:hypothetical protein
MKNPPFASDYTQNGRRDTWIKPAVPFLHVAVSVMIFI